MYSTLSLKLSIIFRFRDMLPEILSFDVTIMLSNDYKIGIGLIFSLKTLNDTSAYLLVCSILKPSPNLTISNIYCSTSFMVSWIRFRAVSTSVTFTLTCWCSLTTSLGLEMYLFASCEIWTSPSCLTPTSTKAPKFVIFVPNPGYGD